MNTPVRLFCFLGLAVGALCPLHGMKSLSMPDIDFNNGWLFHQGAAPGAEQPGYRDAGWRAVDLPHDWSIEGPFDRKWNARTGGLPVHGTGWYRKHFQVPAEHEGRVVSIEFDGAMMNAHVWVNGEFVGNRPYGYIGFEFDLTPHIRFGEDNVIAVRLTPEDLNMRWYAGAGIYRNTRLKVNHPVHIPQWGTFVTTPVVGTHQAVVDVETSVRNASSRAASGKLKTVIVNPEGHLVRGEILPFELPPGDTLGLEQNFVVEDPQRWDIDTPVLYKAISQVLLDGKVVDEYATDFGIRTIRFHAEDGFFLNGRRVQLNGVCMHHDLGPLGAAVNDRATERQMEIMQSMGVNSLRTAHNPPSREVVEVCDRLGIVVIVEAFDEWAIGKVPNGYNQFFEEWHEADLRSMIRRDRNSPSVIMWSIGNEILEQGRKDGWKVAKRLNDICHDEDLTRPTTAGFNNHVGAFRNKLAFYVDVVGLNYKPMFYQEVREQYPEIILYGSETSSQTSSRGYYELPLSPDFQKETNQASSYDVIFGPPWAYAPDVEFWALKNNPSVLGEYLWTGFDYLGEPTPFGGRDNSTNGYWNDDWPSRSSYFAPVDLSGMPKDRYYLYQSQWTDEPMVHLLPHWNWEGREGEDIPVFVYTNGDEAELFLNGKSLGRKVKGEDTTTFQVYLRGYQDKPFESEYRLSWDVPYKPGTLKVVAYRQGRAVAEKSVTTAGAPAGLRLEADRSTLSADGRDLSFVTVTVVDRDGNPCPLADNPIKFSVEGAGQLVAVGNGNAASLESFQADHRKAFHGKCMAIVGAGDQPGSITLRADSEGLISSNLMLKVSK